MTDEELVETYWADIPVGTPVPNFVYVERLRAVAVAASAQERARAEKAEAGMEELRKAVAELNGFDVETWPSHGNASLAIAAGYALTLRNLNEQRARAERAEKEAELQARATEDWHARWQRACDRLAEESARAERMTHAMWNACAMPEMPRSVDRYLRSVLAAEEPPK